MGLLSALKLKLPKPGQPGARPPPAKQAPGGGSGSPVGRVGEAVKAATLTARVKAADDLMNAALTAANRIGNPLNSRTQGAPESKARQYWQTGMVKYWQPGSAARQQALSLQGEARIAKAQQAAALLAKARAVFQQGMQLI